MTKLLDAAIAAAEQKIYVDNVSFFAESARIVCVSVGSISTKDKKLSIKSIVEQDENKILFQLTKVMDFMVGEDSRSARPKYNFLCGHNAMEFDFPFLMRRYMKWKMKLPRLLDNYGKKPWEMPLLDTALIWKGSSYKYYAQLAMICDCLGVESPKGEMDGSMVAEYFRAGKWKEIAFYCNDDVIALVNCFMRMNGGEQFDTPDIIIK
jgi:predicted PolB exonuclease-like 3'-5' exonuclease